jgi:hypothetical protein
VRVEDGDVRLSHGSVIVIAGHNLMADLADSLGAQVGIRSIADQVPQAQADVDVLSSDVIQHGLESLQIAVDVG